MAARSTTLRPLPALAVGTCGVLLALVILLPLGRDLSRVVPALLLLLPVLVAGILGGRIAAVGVAAEAAFAFSLFLPPIGSPLIELSHDVFAFALFVVVAGASGVLLATIVSTERRHAAAELARAEALDQVNRQQSALLRSVSHDLRTPLATIRAAATDLGAGVPYDEATRDELLGMVVDEAERLDRLVANLLSLSRIEAGALLPDRDAVELRELVQACVHRLRRMLSRVEVVLDLPPDLPLVLADYTQLDQVLSNLLENAARHSPPAGEVRVASWVDHLVGSHDRVVLTVDDSGPGVDPTLRDQIFEPFATTTGASSSGIGLAICRAVMTAHEGTITVSDAPTGGARFTITLPIVPASSGSEPASVERAVGA